MNFAIEDKRFFITGVANKKSIAYFCAHSLIQQGAICDFAVQTEQQQDFVTKHFPQSRSYRLDVQKQTELAALAENLKKDQPLYHGFLHSIAYAEFEAVPFHQTSRENFLQATQISAFSLVEISNALLNYLAEESSIATVSISTTKATSYGYMGPIKAMLESIVDYLAKSLSEKKIRVNAVGAGPLKTSASAGIPNYIENYLYSEKLTLRKKNLHTQEVANTLCYLLSPLSSAHNASVLRLDAGMSCNYFDQELVSGFVNS